MTPTHSPFQNNDATTIGPATGQHERLAVTSADYRDGGNAYVINQRFTRADAPSIIITPGVGGDQQPIGSHLVDVGKELGINVTDAQRVQMIQDLKAGHLSEGSLALLNQMMQGAAEKGLEGRAGEVLQRTLNDIIDNGSQAAGRLGETFATKAARIEPLRDGNGVERYSVFLTDGKGVTEYRLNPVGRQA